MKPIFIRNHEKEVLKKQNAYFELVMKSGNEEELEDQFARREDKAKYKQKKRMF